MEASQILDIRARIVATADSVEEVSVKLKKVLDYPEQAEELRRMSQRMFEMFSEIKLEQAE